MNHDSARQLIRRHFEAGLEGGQWEALREHVRGCSACKQAYDEAAAVERALSNGDPLGDARLSRLGKVGPPPGPPVPLFAGRHRRTWVASGLAAAAAVVLAVVATAPADEAPEFSVRGGGAEAGEAWVTPYARGPDGKVRRLGGRLSADEALLFAYSNLRGSPGRYLAIVGRDAAGRAHWYHPAWEDPDAPPAPLEIAPGDVDVELLDAVRAAHAPGRLEICGLFMRAPIEVSALDREIEAGRWPAGVRRDCRVVEVER